ncbi:MAG: NADAR family protein [Oscillospiraceae bacterium]|nr:NADAR family protein [Oscillospiraceae bacterium]
MQKIDLNPSAYRDPWLAEGILLDRAIGFFPREFYCLDNYSANKIEYDGFVYGTVEEAYQASAFRGVAEDVVEQIRNAGSPYEAKQIFLANKDRKRPDWDSEKVVVMEELLREKVRQHPYVKEMLLKTKDYTIVEDSPKDSYWDWGPDRDGENNMGKLWMKIRDELLEENS